MRSIGVEHVVERVLRIRPSERRITGLLVGLMFVAMASSTAGESGIDALFFDRVGPDALPMMYLLQAAAAVVTMLALAAVLGRLGHRRSYLAAPIGLGAFVLAERAVLSTGVRWIFPVLWVTVALSTLIQGVYLWGTAGAVVDTRQAKRLFPIFGAGGILGAVAGGLATRPLAPAIGAENLLAVWAAGLALAFVLCRLALRDREPAPHRRVRGRRSALADLAEALGFVRRSRLLVWMTIAAVLFSVLFYSLFLPFAQAATTRFPDAERLAGFFGLFWAGVTGGAFVVSILVANRLFAWTGIAATVVVLPLLYAGAFGLLLVESGFVTIVALRVVIGVWLQGVASPAWETLVNVVPESRRDQTRAFVNGGPTQAGTAIAGVVALVGQDVLSLRQFAWVGLAAALLTTAATLAIRRSYAGALVDALRAARPSVFDRPFVIGVPIAPSADAESTRVLAAAMRSPDVHTRRLAFELAGADRVGGSLDTAIGLEDEDALVRLAAVRAVPDADRGAPSALLRRLGDEDRVVRAAAAARLLSTEPTAEAVLREVLTDPSGDARRAALAQLGVAPANRAAAMATEATEDPDPGVRATAYDVLAAAAPDGSFERALAALEDPAREVRLAAARVVAANGDRGIAPALAALRGAETREVAVEILRHVRADASVRDVAAFVGEAAARADVDLRLAARVPAHDDATRLLRDAALERGRASALTGLWAASALDDRRETIQTAIQNIDAGPVQRATALETLEAAGHIPGVRRLIALWEPIERPRAHDDAWLADALADEDGFIRRCAELVADSGKGDAMRRGTTALSPIERIMLLRRVPIFARMSPSDLERIADVTEERGYADGETLADEGERGDELYVIVAGAVRIVRAADGRDRTLARRAAGEVVGEMSLLTRAARVASIVADGSVRVLRIGHREFESMLRERPEIALGVMRVLAERLSEDASGEDVRA